MKIAILGMGEQMFKIPWFKAKDAVVVPAATPAPAGVAAKLPAHVKSMSSEQLLMHIKRLQRPDRWAITRALATGKYKSIGYIPGKFSYPHFDSDTRREKRRLQIEKGIVQVSPDVPYKSSKTPEWLAKQEELKKQREAQKQEAGINVKG